MSKDRMFYDQQAERELRLAARAESCERRKFHLNQAAAFATLGERADDRQRVSQA